MATKEKQQKLKGKCPHTNIKRDPPKDETEINQQERIKTKKRNLNRQEESLDRLVDKAAGAEAAGNLATAAQLLDEAVEVEQNMLGDRFEQKVAEDTNAKEMSVKLTCLDCSQVIGEFDVVTEDGVVKECKASWNQVKEDQFVWEQALAQRPDVFGPGTVVHIAIPSGERGRLDRKFGDKANAAGNIQEH